MRKTSLDRKCNTYINTFILSLMDAQIFSREISWDILDVVRKAGARGIPAKGIREELEQEGVHKYPMSTIFQALEELEHMEWVGSTTRPFPSLHRGRPSEVEIIEKKKKPQERGGRPSKVYTSRIWSPISIINDEFLDEARPILEKNIAEIKEPWLQLLQKIVDQIKDAKPTLFPQDPIHPDCGLSHEGYEFLMAVSWGVLSILEDEKEWKDLARKNKFMDRE